MDGEADGDKANVAAATAEAMRVIEHTMRPGVSVSELQRTGREVFRRHGIAASDEVIIFFHGLGLSHMDLEHASADWRIEKGMVIANHLLVPGDATHRYWLEDVALVGDDGAEPLFTWDFEPL